MHLYIDESGQFRPLDMGRSRAAAVAGIVIPSASRMRFGRDFRKLKRVLGFRNVELKGSSLSETMVARVLRLLRTHGAIAEAVVIDVGQHDNDTITRFKTAQGERLIEHITRDHQPRLIQDLLDLQRRLSALPNQLFVQAFCIWQLIPRLIETATMFYSQRVPRELGSFVWRVDAKDTNLTEMEELWTQLIGPIVTTRSQVTPMGMVPGGDYSFYARFDGHAEDGAQVDDKLYTDFGRILREDFQFVGSHADLGVQAVDVVVSAITRALNGTLEESGWLSLAPLLVRRRRRTIQLIALDPDHQPHTRRVANDGWRGVIHSLEKAARPMLTPQTARMFGGALLNDNEE